MMEACAIPSEGGVIDLIHESIGLGGEKRKRALLKSTGGEIPSQIIEGEGDHGRCSSEDQKKVCMGKPKSGGGGYHGRQWTSKVIMTCSFPIEKR